MIAKISTLITLLISSTTLAAPLIDDLKNETSLPNEILRRREKGDCDNKHLPRQADYIAGINSFCKYFNPTKENPNPIKTIDEDKDLVVTVTLKAYDDGKDLPWVYRIGAWTDTTFHGQFIDLDYNTCKSEMTNLMAEGTLGKEYCVVAGTKDVLFMGAKKSIPEPGWGFVQYESRKRR